jgi:hypothetical protein
MTGILRASPIRAPDHWFTISSATTYTRFVPAEYLAKLGENNLLAVKVSKLFFNSNYQFITLKR